MIIEKLNQDLKDATKSRDQVRLGTLRMLKSKILNADARGNLPDADVVKLFKTYHGNLQEALDLAKSADRQENAERLMQEQKIVEEYLPKASSMEETREVVNQAILQTGAKTKKDLSLVMRSIKTINSAVDGKLAKELLDQLLT